MLDALEFDFVRLGVDVCLLDEPLRPQASSASSGFEDDDAATRRRERPPEEVMTCTRSAIEVPRARMGE